LLCELLIFANEHINIVLLASNNISKVLNDDMEATDVFTSVVALSAARGNGGDGRNWD
jgi:hypothetical protein